MLRKVERLTARSAPRTALELVHDASHVERVLAEPHHSVELDEEAWIGPGTRTAALLAVGGLLEAVAAVIAGELRNAFVIARPPGHHAEAARPMGFCLLNATAVAARWAQLARGARRVAILDWDVHHGNGTEAIFRDDSTVLTISLHQDRLYPYDTGDVDAPGEAIVNVPLPVGTGDAGYALAFERVVEPAIRSFAPDLLLIGAGQDAAASDPLGRMSVTTSGFREWTDRAVELADECCGGRVVAFLEGGYSLRHLPAANLAILEGAGRPALELPRGPGRLRHPARAARRRDRGGRGGGVMVHDAHGWWIREAGGVPPAQPALAEALRADVVVIGGGYTGMWTAWEVLEREPNARVVLLEADRCGTGPSGRNGGFLSSLWLYRANMAQQYGERRARELCEASDETLAMVAAFCEAQEVDAWLREAPHLVVSCAPAQDGASADAVDGEHVVALSEAETRAVCDAPVFRAGVATRTGATVQPARLAFGLRDRLLARGVRIFEGSRVTRAARRPRRRRGGRDRRRQRARGGRGGGDQRRLGPGAAPARPPHGLLQPHRADRAGARRDRAAGLDRRRGDHRRARAAALLPHHPGRPHPARLGRRADGGRRAHARARGGRRRGGRADAARAAADLPDARGAADRARLGRADRRLPHPPAGDRHAAGRPRVGGVRLHRQRRRALAPGRPLARRARARANARRPRAGPGSTRRRSASRPSRCGPRARP